MAKKEWINWLKCNALEILILILVIVLLVKVFSAPAVGEISTIPAVEGSAVSEMPAEAAPAAEVPLEEAPTEEVHIE